MVLALWAAALSAQDAREIVRQSIELDQVNWIRMRDYTWVARSEEHRLDARGRIKSVDSEVWETLVLYGQPYRRILERHGRPLPPDQQREQQEKLDRYTARLQRETAAQREQRLARYEKQRRKDREFLREIPDLFEFRLEGAQKLDGRDVWVIAASPKPGAVPKQGDAKALLKIQGKLWIDQTEYQWVRVEAETLEVISCGLVLARLDRGARLIFEQTRVNDEVWLPRREWLRGSGRIGLIKRVATEEVVTWSQYRKFQADSRIVPR